MQRKGLGKTWIEVSRYALESNFDALKKVSSPAQVMAIVKANAYGHGLKEVVQTLARHGVKRFGVDCAVEAHALRAVHRHARIVVLGFVQEEDMNALVREGISFVVYDKRGVQGAAKAGTRSRPARVHLKLETGLYRQGVPRDELASLVRSILAQPTVIFEGASMHYANIEDTTSPRFAMEQLDTFHEMIREIKRLGGAPKELHTACSAATILYPQTRMNVVRTGIALYGLWPSEGVKKRAGKRLHLRPALTWKTVVAQVKRVPAGARIGYGLTHRFSRPATIAVLPIGYADGFDRVAQSGRGVVLIRGKRCPIVGRICMNMCMVDVSSIAKSVCVNDEVVLLGKQGSVSVTAEEFAERMGSISYEVVARLNPLIKKVVL